MEVTLGKKIDYVGLNRELDKRQSVKKCREMSLAVKTGSRLNHCPICQATNFHPIQIIYNFEYCECSDCKAAFVSNVPEDKEIETLYKSLEYTQGSKIVSASDQNINFRIDQIAKPKVDYILRRVTTPKKTWLDIGCGIGEILYVLSASEGWSVTGVETNDAERDYGINHFGLNIIDKYINKDNVNEFGSGFGVISLFGVLEHMKDPMDMVRNISELQEIDDYLVLEVPHHPSFSGYSQISFPEVVNRGMHPPLHLFMFSIDSLKYILESCGYEITHAWYFGQDFYEIWSTFALFTNNSLSNSVLNDKMTGLINDFQQVIDNQMLSDEVLIIARKR